MLWYEYLIVLSGSFLAGVINTLAGNGSAITLTILTELLGLPGNLANGTNRVGVWTQSLAGGYAFYRGGRLQVQRSGAILLWTSLGAIAGVALAVYVSSAAFIAVFRILLLIMLVVILVKPQRWLRESDTSYRLPLYVLIPLFLALGFYGGFIQMGMGVFFLAATVLGARYSIIEANAVKVTVVAIYTLLVLFIFHWRGLIDWPIGLLMAIGQTAGGYLTARYAVRYPRANIIAHRVLVAVVLLALIRLFDIPTLFQ